MAKEICISSTPHETRLAILEDDQLAEIYYERENEYTLAGSIYKGRVTRVLPGMQSSFVDVGLERDAFLYVTDFLEEQEDSEDYVSESNGGGRQRSAGAEEEPARGGSDRGPERGPERNSERNPERSAERNGEQRSDRNQDRNRRPAAPAIETARDQSREQARAGRERAREQVVAPLREAVPAAQDLEEKGDEQTPEGTRRWRGRRGRRRGGMRGGLPQIGSPLRAQAEPLLSDTPEALEEASTVEESMAAPFIVAEHGAPGGVASLHASPAANEEDQNTRFSGGRSSGFSDTSPESYASASGVAAVDRNEVRVPAATLLPGESISKYGSVPAVSGTVEAQTASVPKPPARPVNFVAPRPSTLVELSSDWDGGAVLPGETLSRYRGPALSSSASQVVEEPAAPASGEQAFIPDEPAAELPLSLQVESPADSPVERSSLLAEHWARETSAQLADPSSSAVSSSEQAIPAEEGLDQIEAEAEPAGFAQRSDFEELRSGEQTIAPLAEPEIVAQAVSSEAEAHAPQVAEPRIAAADGIEAHWTETQAAEPGNAFSTAATTEPVYSEPSYAELTHAEETHAEPAEYEPENASASYRVSPAGASELRLPTPEAEEATLVPEFTAVENETEHAPAAAEFEASFFKPAEERNQESVTARPAHTSTEVPEFDGGLAAGLGEGVPEEAAPATAPAPTTLSILHEDGTIESAPAATNQPEAEQTSSADAINESLFTDRARPQETFEPDFSQPDFSGQTPHFDPRPAPTAASQPSDFSAMVDQLHGYASSGGLLEEELIEEEEYDFEPMHAHADEADQEDLEEETLDQQMDAASIGEAVRDSHLEQRVRGQMEGAVANGDLAHSAEQDEEPFGFEEVEDDEEEGDEEEPGVQTAQPGEPQRQGRNEDRNRGRGRNGARSGRRNGAPGRGRSAQSQDMPIISDMLKQGQEILVQIAKEPMAKKGARITSHIALPGRFLVFMPTVSHVGVSRKIASDEERQRLKRILISEKGESSGGFIVRTAAEGASEEDLRADLRFLISLWTEIKQRSDTAKAPALIYHDLNLIERILRDQVSSNFSTIWVDSEAEYERIIRFLSRFQPQLVRRVKLYTKETPLFEHFGIQEEISKALKSKVWLKSGGSIVINQTEALVAIDINTGKYVGKTARLEDTIVKTNLDAIPEIVRQVRLRDLGGIIVIDFIDMDERKNRNRVLAALEEELKRDRAPSKVLQFNDFGLVAITRKRVKQSLERTLSVQCEVCTGTGMVKSPMTVCNEIYTEMRKMAKHLDGKDVMLRVNPEVVKQLKANNSKWINELEELVAKTIIIKSDPALHPEQFDIH